MRSNKLILAALLQPQFWETALIFETRKRGGAPLETAASPGWTSASYAWSVLPTPSSWNAATGACARHARWSCGSRVADARFAERASPG
jgi:hypothetical protein